MAYVDANNVGRNSATLYIAGLNTSTTYDLIKIYCNGYESGDLARSYAYHTSVGWSVPFLSCGRKYPISWHIISSGGSERKGIGTLETLTCPVDYSVGSIPYVTVEPSSSTSGRLYVTWGSATNATHYGVEVLYNGNPVAYNSNIYGTSYEFSGIPHSRYYTVKVYGKRAGSSNGTPYYTSQFYMPDNTPPVGYVSYVSAVASSGEAGKVTVEWSSASNATHYGVELHYYGSAVKVDSNVYGTRVVFNNVPQYRNYTVKVYGKRAGSPNGTPNANATVFTPDLTPPTIVITSSNGDGRIYFSYYGSDGQSGLRSSSTYLTQIGSADGGINTLGASAYTTLTQKSFSSDTYGSPFIHNAYYYVGVYSYDNAGNSSARATTRVQFKSARPSNAAWHTTKSRGQPFTLTALEWNSFTIKINQFRTYKNYGLYSFSNVSRGQTTSATIMNQARTAIAQIVPPVGVPSPANKGDAFTADFLNGLVRSLNSIT